MGRLFFPSELVALRRERGSSFSEVPGLKYHSAVRNTWFGAQVNDPLLTLDVVWSGVVHVPIYRREHKVPQVLPPLALPNDVAERRLWVSTMWARLAVNEVRFVEPIVRS